MKAFQVVCVLAFVASAACVPVTQKPNTSDVEVAIVPLSAQQDLFDIDDGVVDTGYPGGMFFNPFGNPFSGFMSSMDDMLRRLHDQMSQVLHRLPVDNTNPDWVDLSDGKGNTTSTSKVINGHKVTVNETVYGDDGNNSGSFFKIRIVDVRPTSEESTENSDEKTDKTKLSVLNKDVEETTPRNIVKDNSSPELTEESNNEIPQGKPENQYPLEFDDVETFGEDFTNEVFPERPIPYAEVPDYPYFEHDDINNAEPVREIESNSVDFKPIDLSNDIYVNQMMADQGAPQNPDAEVFNPYENQHNAPRSFEYLQDPSFYMVKRR